MCSRHRRSYNFNGARQGYGAKEILAKALYAWFKSSQNPVMVHRNILEPIPLRGSMNDTFANMIVNNNENWFYWSIFYFLYGCIKNDIVGWDFSFVLCSSLFLGMINHIQFFVFLFNFIFLFCRGKYKFIIKSYQLRYIILFS